MIFIGHSRLDATTLIMPYYENILHLCVYTVVIIVIIIKWRRANKESVSQSVSQSHLPLIHELNILKLLKDSCLYSLLDLQCSCVSIGWMKVDVRTVYRKVSPSCWEDPS